MEEVGLNSHCTIVLERTYGVNHMDHGIFPSKRYINLDLCICTIPTLGFYEKYGREHPPLSHQVGATASPPPHNVAHHQSAVLPHFLPSPTTVTVAPAAAATTVAYVAVSSPPS